MTSPAASIGGKTVNKNLRLTNVLPKFLNRNYSNPLDIDEMDNSNNAIRGAYDDGEEDDSEEDLDLDIIEDFDPNIDEEDLEIPNFEEISVVSGKEDLPIFNSEYYNRKLAMPKLSEKMWEYLQVNPILSDQIQLYDNWIKNNFINNLQSRHNTYNNNFIFYENIMISSTTYNTAGDNVTLTPQKCRNMNLTYAAQVYADIVLKSSRESKDVIERIDKILLFQLPIMINSVICVLKGKSPEELLALGEDPRDIGGYFIIKGLERIVLSQEQLALNRIMLMQHKEYGVICRITANTLKGTSLFQLALQPKIKQLVVAHLSSIKNKQRQLDKNRKKDDASGLNVLHIFQLFGYNNEDDIKNLLSMFIPEEQRSKCLAKLADNFFDLSLHPDPVIRIMEQMSLSVDKDEQKKKITHILMHDLFPHLNDLPPPHIESTEEYTQRIYWYKLHLLCVMLSRYLQYFCGYRKLDNRGSISNKRFESAGRAMEQFTRTAWRKVINMLQNSINSKMMSSFSMIRKLLESNSIGTSFEISFAGSKWGPKGSKTKNNVAAIMDITTVISSYSHRLTLNVPVFRKDSRVSNREVVLSQYGKICAAATPEGNNCGFLKQLALLARVTLENDDQFIIRYLIPQNNIESKVMLQPDEINDTQIIVYAKFLGWVNGEKIYNELLLARQKGIFSNQISIVWMSNEKVLYLDSGPSILIHPVLPLDNQGIPILMKPVIENDILLYDNLSDSDVSEWFRHGGVIYMSSWEQDQPHIKIADRYEDVIYYMQEREKAYNKLDKIKRQLHAIKNNEEVKIKRYGEVILTKKIAKERVNKARERLNSNQSIILHGNLTTSSKKDLQKLLDDAKKDLQLVNSGREVKREMRHYTNLTIKVAEERYDSAMLQIKKLQKIKPFTHVQFDGQVTVSLLCSLINGADQDQGPRVTYQINMSKQATGQHHPNYRNRIDKKSRRLLYQQEPIAQTESFRYLGLHYRAPSQNLMLAFMAYPGNEEDGAVWSTAAIDAGMFRLAKQMAYSTKFTVTPLENLIKPVPNPREKVERYDALNEQGLPYIGAYISQGKCIIGKTVDTENGIPRNESVYMRFTEEGVVQWVKAYKDNSGRTIIIVYLTITPRPQLGDKGAGAHAQKNTINRQIHNTNLPYTLLHGINPDIIINPSSIPSRMTVGYLREIYFSKTAILSGDIVNMTPFRTFQKLDEENWQRAYLTNEQLNPLQKARETLKAYGYEEMGYERMISGYTGKELDIPIFMGNVKFETLKHRVIDKGQFRGIGRVKTQTRQPNEGRSSGGGLRIGEMEKDSLIGHGAAYLTLYFLMYASDAYVTVFCKNCGIFAEYDKYSSEYICRKCQKHKQNLEHQQLLQDPKVIKEEMLMLKDQINRWKKWFAEQKELYNEMVENNPDDENIHETWDNIVNNYNENMNNFKKQYYALQNQKSEKPKTFEYSFGKTTIPYVFKLFMQMMTSIGLFIQLDLKNYDEVYDELMQPNKIVTKYNPILTLYEDSLSHQQLDTNIVDDEI